MKRIIAILILSGILASAHAMSEMPEQLVNPPKAHSQSTLVQAVQIADVVVDRLQDAVHVMAAATALSCAFNILFADYQLADSVQNLRFISMKISLWGNIMISSASYILHGIRKMPQIGQEQHGNTRLKKAQLVTGWLTLISGLICSSHINPDWGFYIHGGGSDDDSMRASKKLMRKIAWFCLASSVACLSTIVASSWGKRNPQQAPQK